MVRYTQIYLWVTILVVYTITTIRVRTGWKSLSLIQDSVVGEVRSDCPDMMMLGGHSCVKRLKLTESI